MGMDISMDIHAITSAGQHPDINMDGNFISTATLCFLLTYKLQLEAALL